MRGYCPHFREVIDLEDCYFCYFKKVEPITKGRHQSQLDGQQETKVKP